MMTDDQQDRIDKYLLGRLPDRKGFDEQLSSDAELRREVADTRMAMDAIELSEDIAIKDRLRKLEAERSGGAKVIAMKPKRSSPMRWLAYAAALLLLVVAGYFLLQQEGTADYEQLALADFEPYPNIAYTITKGSNEETQEAAAFSAYEAADYETAARNFSQLPQEDPIYRFYLAQSQLALGDFVAARANFVALSDQAGFNLAQEAAYYAAVAGLGAGDLQAARTEIVRIADDAGHPSRREALNLLSKLPE